MTKPPPIASAVDTPNPSHIVGRTYARTRQKKAPAAFNDGGLARRFWGLGAEPPISRSVAPELHPEVNPGCVQSEPCGRSRQKPPTYFAVGGVRPAALRAADTTGGCVARKLYPVSHCESEARSR